MQRAILETPFSTWLDSQLRERGWGKRTLARHMDAAAGWSPSDPERARRAVNRYMFEGRWPTDTFRPLIAQALSIDEDELPESDDEEPG